MNGCWCVGRSFLPSFLQGHRKRVSEGARESRVQVNCGCPSNLTSQYLLEHTQRWGGGVGEGGCRLSAGWTLPGLPARRQSLMKGVPSRAGSWGFLGVAGACAWGCDAWEVCHSGWGCGRCGECHRGSGRSRWPFRWVPAGHSPLALVWDKRKDRGVR